MTFTLYDATIVQVRLVLATLHHLLNEAEKQPNAESLLQARLYEDMKPLTFQVHAATRFSEKLLARLSGREGDEFEDNLTSYTAMHERIENALKDLATADKNTINRHGEEVASTDLPSWGKMDLPGKSFAMGVAVPNIMFHLNMTYAILRKEGVPLGKKDYGMEYFKEYLFSNQPQESADAN